MGQDCRAGGAGGKGRRQGQHGQGRAGGVEEQVQRRKGPPGEDQAGGREEAPQLAAERGPLCRRARGGEAGQGQGGAAGQGKGRKGQGRAGGCRPRGQEEGAPVAMGGQVESRENKCSFSDVTDRAAKKKALQSQWEGK